MFLSFNMVKISNKLLYKKNDNFKMVKILILSLVIETMVFQGSPTIRVRFFAIPKIATSTKKQERYYGI